MPSFRGLVLLTLTSLVLAAPARANLEDCGAAKVQAMARACADLLAAEAKRLRTGNGEAHALRLDAIRARTGAAWDAAEAGPDGVECAARTASSDFAVDLVQDQIVHRLADAGPDVCQRKLALRFRAACRRVARFEAAVLTHPTRAGARAEPVAREVGRRARHHWPARGCAPWSDASLAERLVFEAAGMAAGTATTRSIPELAESLERDFGVAIEPHEVDADAAYESALPRTATSLTAENAMKWGPLHPQPTTFRFDAADAVVARAREWGMRLRGHTLVWAATQLPSYVRLAQNATELRGFLTDHIQAVLGRYAGDIEQWDVVNEPLSGLLDPATPDGLDDNVFRALLGPGYISEALALARGADPEAKLYVNENGVLSPGPRQDRFFALIEGLRDAGAPLDGVGFQGHIGLTPPSSYPRRETIASTLQRFADLGLDVEITELDISSFFLPGPPEQKSLDQARLYRDVIAACIDVDRCRGITTWGLSDQYTWIRTFFGFPDDPLPFDDDWRRKPAWFGIRSGLVTGALEAAQ